MDGVRYRMRLLLFVFRCRKVRSLSGLSVTWKSWWTVTLRSAAAFWPGKDQNRTTTFISSDSPYLWSFILSVFHSWGDYHTADTFAIRLKLTSEKSALLRTLSAQPNSTDSSYAGYCRCRDPVVCWTELVFIKPGQYARLQTFLVQLSVITQTSTWFNCGGTQSCKQASLTAHFALVKHRCN